jgi:hypothetical protein
MVPDGVLNWQTHNNLAFFLLPAGERRAMLHGVHFLIINDASCNDAS